MMDTYDEIEMIENIISDLESAISEVKGGYFDYKIDSWEEDIADLNERLRFLEEEQDKEWAAELAQENYEFESSRL